MTEGTGKPRTLAVFVHGIHSDWHCWDKLCNLLSNDPAMRGFELACFPYESKHLLGFLNIKRRVPNYRGIAKDLDGFIGDRFDFSSDRELQLVGHSQGGLIIQEWLFRRLEAGEGQKLRNLRQAILIGTPTLGSNLFYGLRQMLFRLVPNPQEARLRPLDERSAEVRRAIEEQVMNATAWSDRTALVPIVSFSSSEDNVVPSVSAEASFDLSYSLKGDHSTIIVPDDRGDERYSRIAERLLEPEGHKHVYAIKSYLTTLRVEPLFGDKQTYVAQRSGETFTEQSDNFARLERVVCFSDRNHCLDLFVFNYQTNRRGYLRASVDMQPRKPGELIPPNEARPDEKSGFAETGSVTTYRFTPRANKCHSQAIDIWNGFSANGRDIHFHTGNNFRATQYTLILDLSPYVAAGFAIIDPQLFVEPRDDGECRNRLEQRIASNRIPISESTDDGIITWRIPEFSGGIVDVVWNVDGTQTKQPPVENT
ncbi:MAG TPA: alpha/beta hydrolase [Bryobacteraceae bacterium]